MYIWPTVLFFALIPYVLSSHFRGGLLTWKAVNETQVCVHVHVFDKKTYKIGLLLRIKSQFAEFIIASDIRFVLKHDSVKYYM